MIRHQNIPAGIVQRVQGLDQSNPYKRQYLRSEGDSTIPSPQKRLEVSESPENA